MNIDAADTMGYTCDPLGWRIQTAYADGSAIAATYVAGNRVIALNDASNGILQFGWNGLNELTQATSPQGTVDYTYDAIGRRTSMAAGSQVTVDYGYDNANRLIAETQGAADVAFSYDAANRRSTLTLPNGVTMTTDYDAANEITGIAYAQGNGSSLGSLTYAYDAAGRRISEGGTLASDALPTATTQASAFDLDNRQTGFNGVALSYDADGNLTFDGTRTYVWNARNQLIQIKQGGSVVDSFSYDALGRRQSKSIDGEATSFLYDGENPVQEAQGATMTPILTGLGVDQYFARPEASGEAYMLTGAQGSVIGLTDASGNLIQRYHYGPYGEANANNPGITNPFQYTGRENDGDGLYYYRARYYSPSLKRFISEDPAGFGGGQDNFFAYAGGNPVSYRDPSGEGPDPYEIIGGAIIGAVEGYMAGQEAGDTGVIHLGADSFEGGAVGAAAGLTDNYEWLGFGSRALLNAGVAGIGEAARDEINYHCIDASDVDSSMLASVLGDGASALSSGLIGMDALNGTLTHGERKFSFFYGQTVGALTQQIGAEWNSMETGMPINPDGLEWYIPPQQ